MILEIADITIKPGLEAEFEAGVQRAAALFEAAKGCKSMKLKRSTERPSRYLLFVGWETLENHTVDFRNSANFTEWRNLVSHCFAEPPRVEHAETVLTGF